MSNPINRLHNLICRECDYQSLAYAVVLCNNVRRNVNKGNNYVIGVLDLFYTGCDFVACNAEDFEKKNQLMDARASKHVKMGEPEVAFDHAVETEAINVYA